MPAAYVETWDPNTPQASESRSLGDDRIRELKRGLAERFGTIMNFPDGNPLRLLDGTVSGATLNDHSISTDKIIDGAVTLPKLAPESVDATKIVQATQRTIASFTVYETTAGASLNHAGSDVVLSPGNNLTDWIFTGIPGLIRGNAPGAIVTVLPGRRPSLLTFNVISASSGPFTSPTSADALGWLNWNCIQSQYADGSLTVYASWSGTGSPITVTKDTIFHFGILNLLDNTY